MEKKKYTYEEALAILSREKALDVQRYLKFCKQCVKSVMEYPQERHIVARDLFGLSSQLEINENYSLVPIGEIRGILLNLEIPDAHIDTSKMTVDEQWQELGTLVDKALQTLNR